MRRGNRHRPRPLWLDNTDCGRLQLLRQLMYYCLKFVVLPVVLSEQIVFLHKELKLTVTINFCRLPNLSVVPAAILLWNRVHLITYI